MDTLDAHLKLNNLHCYDEADGPGNAEPYLWAVFFKIDGDTTVVNANFALQGSATVIGTPGNHRNLPDHSVGAGENVPIPVSLGEFSTRLKPIPLQKPVGSMKEVGGVMGLITVLMEQDSTSGSAIAKGHTALDKAVRDSLNALIPTLTITHQEPTDAEIEAMKKKIGDTVTKAVETNVGVWDWLSSFGDMDDKIGSEVFRFSHKQLAAGGVSGLSIKVRFKNQGDWELTGVVKATPVGVATGGLTVGVNGVPATLTTSPVRVSGPGFSRSLNKTTTLTGLVPGVYQISAGSFTTGQGKPSCKVYTPNAASVQVTVKAGQTASTGVRYTSEPCGL